jgi:hypothetical protein
MGRDELEVAAFHFLKSRYDQIDPEPNGETTFPDFLADGSILFEVTRLEKTVLQGELATHHTRLHRPFGDAIEDELNRFKDPISCQHDLYVNIDVDHPVDRSAARQRVREFLSIVAQDPEKYRGKPVELLKGVKCGILFGRPTSQPAFQLGSCSSMNLNGFIVPETAGQVKEALQRKTTKLSKYGLPFNEAWLVVGGEVSWDYREKNIPQLVKEIGNTAPWTGFVLLNLFRPEMSFQVRC